MVHNLKTMKKEFITLFRWGDYSICWHKNPFRHGWAISYLGNMVDIEIRRLQIQLIGMVFVNILINIPKLTAKYERHIFR